MKHFSPTALCAALGLCLANAIPFHAAELSKASDVQALQPMPLISDGTFLAIDDSVFENVQGMSLETCEAERYLGNPVLTSRPGGSDKLRAGFFSQVLLENGKFRMWYRGGRMDKAGRPQYQVCYAESADGKTWVRPSLGQVSDQGSKENNILKGLSGVPFRDDRETSPARRYKSCVLGTLTEQYFDEDQKKRYGKAVPSNLGFIYSPDGLHWTLDTSNPFPIRAKLEGSVLHRIGERYFMLSQMTMGEHAPRVTPYTRYLGVSYSDDMLHWRLSDAPGFHFDPRFADNIQVHCPHIACLSYGNVSVGCVGLFLDHHEPASHETDLIIILTNNGLTWRQPETARPFSYLLRRGSVGSWDHSFLVQGGLVNHGRQTCVYYSGHPDGGNLPTPSVQTGLAYLRLDGYGYLAPTVGGNFDAPQYEGHVISRPIQIQRKGLQLYLNTTGTSSEEESVRVELQDASGRAIPGFTLLDCDNVSSSGVGVPVTWKGKVVLDELDGRAVRVKIQIQARNSEPKITMRVRLPRFYAFYFDRPALWLDMSQSILPDRGLERLHCSDPYPQRLDGVQFTTDRLTEVTARRLPEQQFALSFSREATVTLSWPGRSDCESGDQRTPFLEGVAKLTVVPGQEIIVRPSVTQ